MITIACDGCGRPINFNEGLWVFPASGAQPYFRRNGDPVEMPSVELAGKHACSRECAGRIAAKIDVDGKARP